MFLAAKLIVVIRQIVFKMRVVGHMSSTTRERVLEAYRPRLVHPRVKRGSTNFFSIPVTNLFTANPLL